MNRQGPYGDGNANPYSGSQMQHMPAQRMQQNAGVNNVHGRPDSFRADQGNPYVSAQWDRDGPRGTHLAISHPYSEARQGSNAAAAAQSFHQAQITDSKLDLENEGNKRPRVQSHEQDMEIGYEDKPSPLTFEVLEQKFQSEILKLLKEQSDAEDAEIARHRERIIEINNQYQEKLAVLRARQASRREEFLRKESEGRLQHYQQAGIGNPLGTTGPNDHHVYTGPAAVEAHRAYPGGKADYDRESEGRLEHYQQAGISNPLGRTGPNDHHVYAGPAAVEARGAYPSGKPDYDRERPPYHGGGRGQGTEGRVPYPAGRVYNNAGARYY